MKKTNRKMIKKRNTKKKVANFIKRWSLLLALATSLLYIVYCILIGLYHFSKLHPNKYILFLAVLGIVFIINDTIADKKKRRV